MAHSVCLFGFTIITHQHQHISILIIMISNTNTVPFRVFT